MRSRAFHLVDAHFTYGFFILVLVGVAPFLCPGTGNAQAITPTTGGGNLGTTVTQNGNIYTITGGTRPGGGANLFHSFGDFNVPTNNIANFLNETGLPTSNILGRVTGGNISNIFGTIQTTGFGNANLFLMNPAGFLFGPNATLNVGGMVAFTTADYLRLGDGVRFNAIPDAAADALLSAAPVAAFGFLGSNPGAITVQGSQFTVTEGTGISLVGGNITIQSGTLDNGTVQPARLSAPNGTIQLASAVSPGEFHAATLQPLPNVENASFASFGSVSLAPGSSVNVSGANTVSIRGGQFVLSVNDAVLTTATTAAQAESVILSNASAIKAETRGADPSGDITLSANTVQLNDGSTIATHSMGGGAAGDIHLTVSESLTLQGIDSVGNPSRILSDTNSSGNGGAINIQAPSGSVLLEGGVIQTSTLSDGLAGDINLNVRDLTARAGGQILTSGSDAAPSGSITVTASDLIWLTGRPNPTDPSSASGIFNVNNGFNGTGNISIQTNNLLMEQGARIRNDAFFDLGGAGVPKISITASNDVTLSGGSGIIVDTTFGDVGSLAVSAHSISLSDVSVISARTIGPGAGGPITLNADTISISGGSQVVSSTEQDAGRGGDVTIVANDRLTMTGQGVDPNGSTVSSGIFTFSSPFATGDAGSVSVSTHTLGISGGAQINSSTFGSGAAGNITLHGTQDAASPAQSILIDGPRSGIFTDTHGPGAGGGISINSNTVTMTNGAAITADSAGLADAGNINITALTGLRMQNSSITTLVTPNTSDTSAHGGNITITTSPSATVYLQDSTISASVSDGPGGGGNISIDPQYVILLNSTILAQASQGNGGSITITAGLFLPDATSAVNADSGSGVNGTVTIQSPNAPASGKINPLSQRPLIATALLSQRCAALANGELSSFTLAGRDNLPVEPGSWLSTPLALSNGFDGGTLTEGGTRSNLTNPEKEAPLLSLRQIAPPGFLTQAFAVNESAGCSS